MIFKIILVALHIKLICIMNNTKIDSIQENKFQSNAVAVIGLGYVGYPLFCSIPHSFECWGMDIDEDRIGTLSMSANTIETIKHKKHFTSSWRDISHCTIFIVTVPTPVDRHHIPDLSALISVCHSLGSIIKPGDIVVFESTVYTGTTEEICVPILEETSGLKLNEDFSVAYSPERINVGDSLHTLENTPKILAASDSTSLDKVRNIYATFMKAPIVIAKNIKVAETAKMYENVQRDVLIALANQFSDFCHEEGIDVTDVTQCASSKWNFSKVNPGLVGGHCIGVDTYYLLNRAISKGINLTLVETARRINEAKSELVAQRILEIARTASGSHNTPSVLLLGFSYKPNTNDIRNTKVADVIKWLQNQCCVDCYDPLVDIEKANKYYGISLKTLDEIKNHRYDVSVVMVSHNLLTDIKFSAAISINLEEII